MNTLNIKMRLLDVIEEKETLAIELKNKNSIEGIRRYRALDKEKDELIDMLKDGQAKKSDSQFSLSGLLMEIQENIEGIKKSIAILQKQTEKRTVRYGNLIFSSSEANGKDLALTVNSSASKREVAPEIPVQEQHCDDAKPIKLTADLIGNGVINVSLSNHCKE